VSIRVRRAMILLSRPSSSSPVGARASRKTGSPSVRRYTPSSTRQCRWMFKLGAGGNVNDAFYEGIVAALDAGIPVVVATRVIAGPTHLGKGYRGSLMSLIAKGAISAGYLSGIKARILLMVALGRTREPSDLAEIFRRADGSS